MSPFSPKFQKVRIAALLVVGAASILLVRARHLAFQHPSVNVAPAPELVGKDWINSGPIRLSDRKGKVTMVEFWTFACSNCQANLPSYERIQERFSKEGFTIIGVHTPELPQERDPNNVRDFVAKHGITYPVLLDREQKNWDRWNQQFWPSIYLVDKKGSVREHWVGELNSFGSNGEEKLTQQIRALLDE